MPSAKGESKAIQIALQTEKDGLEMYTKAAKTASADSGRRMFELLVAEEKKHVEIIQNVARGVGVTAAAKGAAPGKAARAVKTIFSEAKKKVGKTVKATTDDKKAVKMGLDFEKKGYEFYQKAAAEAQDPNEKDLFDYLGKWEQEHYALLQNAADYLNSSGAWFIWEEQGLLEG